MLAPWGAAPLWVGGAFISSVSGASRGGGNQLLCTDRPEVTSPMGQKGLLQTPPGIPTIFLSEMLKEHEVQNQFINTVRYHLENFSCHSQRTAGVLLPGLLSVFLRPRCCQYFISREVERSRW